MFGKISEMFKHLINADKVWINSLKKEGETHYTVIQFLSDYPQYIKLEDKDGKSIANKINWETVGTSLYILCKDEPFINLESARLNNLLTVMLGEELSLIFINYCNTMEGVTDGKDFQSVFEGENN